jgi:hypothetical protein
MMFFSKKEHFNRNDTPFPLLVDLSIPQLDPPLDAPLDTVRLSTSFPVAAGVKRPGTRRGAWEPLGPGRGANVSSPLGHRRMAWGVKGGRRQPPALRAGHP